MPLFEYQCRACGRVFERLHRGGEVGADPACACGSRQVERILYSRTAIAVAAPRAAEACERPQGCCGGGCERN